MSKKVHPMIVEIEKKLIIEELSKRLGREATENEMDRAMAALWYAEHREEMPTKMMATKLYTVIRNAGRIGK